MNEHRINPGDKRIVYVAGPYTSPDPVENTNATVRFASALWDASGKWVPFVPHLSMLWHAITPRPYEDWLEIDLVHMYACSAVVRLPGASSGADAEVLAAEDAGIPVFIMAARHDEVDAAGWLSMLPVAAEAGR